MKSSQALIKEVADQLRAGRLVLFAGAGISRGAGLPVASQIVQSCVDALTPYSSSTDEQLKSVYSTIAPNLRMELLLRSCIDTLGDTGLEPLRLLNGGTPTTAHLLAASMMQKGYLKYVLTTNFDTLFEQACRDKGLDPCIIVTENDCSQWMQTRQTPVIFKLHGSIMDDTKQMMAGVQADVRQVASGLSPAKVSTLQNLLENNLFLFVGYSGRDYFGAMPVLFGHPHKRIIWVEHIVNGLSSIPNTVVEGWLGNDSKGSYLGANTADFLCEVANSLGVLIPPAPSLEDKSSSLKPFQKSEQWLPKTADMLLGTFLKHLGQREVAYAHYQAALGTLKFPEDRRWITMCHLASAELALAGLDGWMHEFTTEAHANEAVKASHSAVSEQDSLAMKLDTEILRLAYASELAQKNAQISTALISPKLVPPNQLLMSTQSLVDACMANGFAELAGRGCVVLAQIWINFYRGTNQEASSDLIISLYEDAVNLMEVEFAQDVLASNYFALEKLCYYARKLDKVLYYNVKRLKALLLLRQTAEHDHVQSCLRMLQRSIGEAGRFSKESRRALEGARMLGFNL